MRNTPTISKRLLAVCLGVCCAMPLIATAVTAEKHVHDAGLVWKGEVLTHTFSVPNNSNEEITIRTVRPSCECVSVPSFPKSIPPQEHGEFEVSVNTRDFDGNFRYSAFIQTEQPRNLLIPLVFVGEVRSAFEITPERVILTEATWGISAPIQEVRIKRISDEPLRVTGVESKTVFVRAKIEEQPSETSNDCVISIEFARNCPIGPLQSTVEVFTDSPLQPSFSIPVLLNVKGAIQVQPLAISLGQLSSTAKIQDLAERVMLQNVGHEPFRILKVSSEPEGQFETEMFVREEGQVYEFSVRPTAIPEAGPIKGALVIETDNEGQRIVRVPISGVVL